MTIALIPHEKQTKVIKRFRVTLSAPYTPYLISTSYDDSNKKALSEVNLLSSAVAHYALVIEWETFIMG